MIEYTRALHFQAQADAAWERYAEALGKALPGWTTVELGPDTYVTWTRGDRRWSASWDGRWTVTMTGVGVDRETLTFDTPDEIREWVHGD